MGPRLGAPSGARGAFERLRVHEGSHVGPRWTKRSPSRTKMDPSWGHVRPRWAQHDQDGPQVGPRWAPSWSKMSPCWSKMSPSWSKMSPSWCKLGPSWIQEGPEEPQVPFVLVFTRFLKRFARRPNQGCFSVLGGGARLYIYKE